MKQKTTRDELRELLHEMFPTLPITKQPPERGASYPRCGWHQELYGLGDRCLMAGVVEVQLPEGGTATLCTTHAERFARGPRQKANHAEFRIIPNQIEAD